MKYDYKIKYSSRKTLGIRISPEEGIVVLAPYRCNKIYIEKLLEEKNQWIEKNYLEILELRKYMGDRNNIDNIMFLGQTYPVVLRYSSLKKSSVEFSENTLYVRLNGILQFNEDNRIKELKTAIKTWYLNSAYIILSERTLYHAQKLGLKYNNISIKNVKSRWGSCSSKGNLNYNIKLMLMPLEVIDYIVVHELSHLVHMNHSKDFWDHVEKYMPDYKVREEKLKSLSHEVKIYWKF
ncbi:hypothetical protein SAMN05444401_1594 [Clostridium amylolyticum]|uniref:YgjP-like metallopeptidase domain-containing protein n=1 Tax=Clostridium amylolyticum TaxID=1121298 RepID=A0A1M6EJJ5_9CLOT|nr:SprT family zinc-dependent metalloprotease [Clostridium amylolyticum]SHI85643.1 hypothetical protein SAMN05444401_1594 [Clostridium amylolyticum]